MSVTRLGVSLLNVVATIESPASHQGTARPDTKNSDVLCPARLPKKSAGTKQIRRQIAAITQSIGVRCMRCGGDYTGAGSVCANWRRGPSGPHIRLDWTRNTYTLP